MCMWTVYSVQCKDIMHFQYTFLRFPFGDVVVALIRNPLYRSQNATHLIHYLFIHIDSEFWIPFRCRYFGKIENVIESFVHRSCCSIYMFLTGLAVLSAFFSPLFHFVFLIWFVFLCFRLQIMQSNVWGIL